MSQSNSFDPDQMLDRIVLALREEPVPAFNDPLTTDLFAANPAVATGNGGREDGAFPIERSLRSQMADYQPELSTPEPVAARPTRGWMRPAMWWQIGATCSVVVLFAVVGLILRPQPGIAEVATAVLKQTWVHVRSVNPDQTVSEAWFSPTQDISASRSPSSTRYEDYRLQVYFSYDPTEQVLFRGPIVWTSQADRFESMVAALQVLVQTNQPPDQRNAHFGVLGSEPEKVQVLDQRIDKITEQDQNWLDYRVTFKYAKFTEPVRMLFRVCTSTKLPHLCRTEARLDGKLVTREVQFDYPGKGPADIYDLGVPKTAKFVDRVPSGDLKLIAESLKAGRARMDAYRAVFVERTDRIQNKWWSGTPEILSRKGDRYRRDSALGWSSREQTVNPGAGVDQREWWLERIKRYQHLPISLQCGPTRYELGRKKSINPDGSKRWEIASVRKYVDNLKPGDLIPSDYAMRPEFICRPPMGLGNASDEPTLVLHPAEGPQGCILLIVRHTKKPGRVKKGHVEEHQVPEKRSGASEEMYRYWLDPQRDYIVMRWEAVTFDQSGKETITSNHTIEEVARSPQGVWYATRFRLKNAVRHQDGKQSDLICQFYVDFDTELPDSLFEPPIVGKQ